MESINSSVISSCGVGQLGLQQVASTSRDGEEISGATERILSVYWKRGKLGAAYFDCSTSELYVLGDIIDVRLSLNHLKNLLSLVNPVEVVTCPKAPDIFLKTLRGLLNLTESAEGEDTTTCTVKKLTYLACGRTEMSPESCKRTILRLRFHAEPPDITAEEHEVFVASLFPFNDESLLISLALLVRHLEKYLPHILLSHESWAVLSVQQIELENAVSVDDETRRALQVFAPQQHPSAFKRGLGRTREGLSLLGLLGRCRSPNGERRMREILASPTKDRMVLNGRLDAVAFFCKPHSQAIAADLASCVSKVRSVAGILTRICQMHGSVAHWKSLYSSIYHAIRIGEVCKKYSSFSLIFKQVSESITVEVKEVAVYLNQVVDFEESSRQSKFSVLPGIDQNLDTMRQTYSRVPEVLNKVAELELKDLPEFIQQCFIVYITELGHLLSVPAWLEGDADTSLYDLPDFQVKFVVDKHVYYKTPRCRELDQILGDIVAQMSHIESNIMVTLTKFICPRSPAILAAVNLIAELDCVLAFAEVARQNNYVRPEFMDTPHLEIVNGRHPLQELCVGSFVPNDTHFGPEHRPIKLLTGPNASGKSVYLKQVALIAYMAHVGSFVPADSVKIGVMDHIRTRIQSVESISGGMSAFYIDLKQMLQCLLGSSPSSLLVIDEFGKGTSEIDGQALLSSCLSHFASRGVNCPLILVSTHFHNVPRILADTSLISLQRMAIVKESDEILCLHKIEDGEAQFSFAHAAAKSAGLSERILARSYQLYSNPERLLPNPSLKISQHIIEEIREMKGLFAVLNAAEDPADISDTNSSL